MTSLKSGLFSAARKALKKKSKFVDDRGLDTRKNYSSFWMDDRWDSYAKFEGLGHAARSGTDTVKLIKLSNYRRAITNFVKIVTKQDIPVYWAGSQSFTDGKSITLSTDIKDQNFDVTVGLALHEASHIILTDFTSLSKLQRGLYSSVAALEAKTGTDHSMLIKDLLNWVEDRRIDNYIFTTSPGYKAYYHKLYDYYWNSKEIIKGLLSTQYSKPTIDNYLFHVINMMNPSFNTATLPGLDRIVKIVDLRNIARINNTDEALEIAVQIAEVILENVDMTGQKQPDDQDQSNEQQAGQGSGTSGEDQSGNPTGMQADGQPLEELTDQELRAVKKAFEKQRDFLNGDTGKKRATLKLSKQLEKVATEDVGLQTVGGDNGVSTQTVLMYDYTTTSRILEAYALAKQIEDQELSYRDSRSMKDQILELISDDIFRDNIHSDYEEALKKGLDMGGLLGKKLQLHNESRERVDTRLRSGKIDNKRLAHAGYGIEGVFKQIHVDKYKKANLHISLDGSGSMGGDKWTNTIQMTAAIAKAATYTQNINVQVTLRVTTGGGRTETPTVVTIYDSRKNKINHLIAGISLFSPNSMTPEGLCFEAMLKKNMFVQSSSEVDSYFLNISDGQPSGCGTYSGEKAWDHTKRQMEKLRHQYDAQVISFFISSHRGSSYAQLVENFNYGHDGKAFKRMYGRDATVVEANNTLMIAKELNKKFLAK